MTAIANNRYLDSLLGGQPTAATGPHAWLNHLRSHAVDRVSALTVPTTRDEEWRFTDISPLTKIPFQPARATPTLTAAGIADLALPEAVARLVFVDGMYVPALSFNNAGISVEPLTSAIGKHGVQIEQHLGRLVDFEGNAFAALNTAFLQEGAVIIVPRGAKLDAPVHLLFMATQNETASYPRSLVIAEPGSSVSIVEDYAAAGQSTYFANAVSEFVLADNAKVGHVRVQRESGNAFHIANCAVSLAHASRYQSVSVTLGGRISRYNLNVLQAAEGAQCTVDGLALIADQQLADTHTNIDHAKAHGVSRQLHKCIVGGAAHAVFNGKIMVRQGAQRTDSSQSSRTLLLTGRARIDTKPQLEIFADDVKCAHGATVGQLDAEEVFYLKSRGLSDDTARNLLTYAFGAEIIERIAVPTLRQSLEQAVLAQTTH